MNNTQTHAINKRLMGLAILALVGASPLALAVTADSTARIIPLDARAFAGSSVNVLANVRHTLFTEGVYQYAAYYAADGYMMLAKRRLGEDQWQLQKTAFKGNVNDAHNHISIVVDGAGYLHVSWDHHVNPLHYARGKAPGSIELGPSTGMIGKQENKVTYPQFIRLPDGDLLFQYRDGGSGNGQLVMNRYNVKSGQWQRVHDNLIDGGGKRSAYWDMTADSKGTLHLAWVWRDTPDVATNHDLAYARSTDGGATWTTLDGKPQPVPMTLDNASYALKIPQNSNLMNSPVVAVDRAGRPFITSYWSPQPGERPRYHVVYANGPSWNVIAGPESAENFNLAGTATKSPPISRANLFIEGGGNGVKVNLIYRNNQGRVVASTLDNLAAPAWVEHALTKDSVGSWEPANDPVQWSRMGETQMLVQSVQQKDGNDKQAETSASGIGVLVWSPNWERHQAQHPTPEQPAPANLNAALRKPAIAVIVHKAADWQWQNFPAMKNGEYGLRSWTLAPFYIGALAVARTIPGSDQEAKVLAQADKIGWQPDKRIYHADDHAVIQAYLQLYLKHRDPKMLAPAKERLDYILANPASSSLNWGTPNHNDRWNWSDALFMGPMSWLLMYEATHDQRYLDFMNREWWATTEQLYRPRVGLYFRDDSFLDMREQNGKTIHWARGTGWAVAGLAQVLEHLPKSHPDYPRYQQQFKEMAAAFLAAQQADGLWRPGILDPKTHTARETSGSSFITFALAWGVNTKLLDAKTYGPAVVKGWNSLTASVTPQGKLENVQPIGAAPHGFDPTNSEPFATGAFLLAASEVYKLATP
ncbi:MAG: BNR-4 repeat-containing protein [Massilia sp.]